MYAIRSYYERVAAAVQLVDHPFELGEQRLVRDARCGSDYRVGGERGFDALGVDHHRASYNFV